METLETDMTLLSESEGDKGNYGEYSTEVNPANHNYENEVTDFNYDCFDNIGPPVPSFDSICDDEDWTDGEEFFSTMDGDPKVNAISWNDKENIDIGFAAESLGDGDWANVEDFFAKPIEEDTLQLDFGYDTTDCYTESIAELYTYSEVPEFEFNMRSFEDILMERKIYNPWQLLTPTERQSIILHLIDMLDIVDYNRRIKAKSTLLYIAQGCWKEIRCLKDQQDWTIYNVSLLMKNGVFDSILELLYFEVEKNMELVGLGRHFMKEETMADSFDLRITLNILYTLVETVRCNEILHSFLPYIKTEISEKNENKKLLATLLFDMLGDFARSKENSHFPVKKIALLLWKVILISLGGDTELREFRKQRRANAGLPSEETSVDTKCESRRKFKNFSKGESHWKTVSDFIKNKRKIPAPAKVTKKEMEIFFDKVAHKYLGRDQPILLDENIGMLFPSCINNVLKTVKQNVYVSLADIQLDLEDKKLNWPHIHNEEFDCINSTEILYTSLLPKLSTYTHGIVKVLSLVAPSTSWRNISEAVPMPTHRQEWNETDTVIRNIDVTRYKDTVFKALSAITLLLLKHTKVNHYLQFEHLSQELVKSEAISGFYSCFKVNSLVYTLKQNYSIERYNFPNCVFGNLPEITMDEIRNRSASSHCQRSAVFGYINAVKILNKLTKGKPHRGLYMAKHSFHQNLIEALKIKEPTFQRYVIKLLKLQVRYIKLKSKSEKERKRFTTSKFSLLTDTYGKVPTNLTDEKWIYFADEEYERLRLLHCSFLEPTTQNLIRRYHWRKYEVNLDADLFPDYTSDLVSNDAIPECDYGEEEIFKNNYESWLDEEVFQNPINWDEFLKEDSSSSL